MRAGRCNRAGAFCTRFFILCYAKNDYEKTCTKKQPLFYFVFLFFFACRKQPRKTRVQKKQARAENKSRKNKLAKNTGAEKTIGRKKQTEKTRSEKTFYNLGN